MRQDPTHRPEDEQRAAVTELPHTFINWQHGAVGQGSEPFNGATVEGVIRAAGARLAEFQIGPLRCQHNAEALDHLSAAIHCLDERTRDRNARGVLGTREP